MDKLPVGDIEKLRWLDEAACADLSINDFFVEAGRGINEQALAVCRECPVRRECLEHAYDREIYGGYFGGVSPGRRRKMKKSEAIKYIEKDKSRKRLS